jgi:hypothetical protein
MTIKLLKFAICGAHLFCVDENVKDIMNYMWYQMTASVV